jgi:hypothetical protein
MQADTPSVEKCIQHALDYEAKSILDVYHHRCPLTVNDTRCIIACLQRNTRLVTLHIRSYALHAAVLSALRSGLLSCPCVTTVKVDGAGLGTEALEVLMPAFKNTSITSLFLENNDI